MGAVSRGYRACLECTRPWVQFLGAKADRESWAGCSRGLLGKSPAVSRSEQPPAPWTHSLVKSQMKLSSISKTILLRFFSAQRFLPSSPSLATFLPSSVEQSQSIPACTSPHQGVLAGDRGWPVVCRGYCTRPRPGRAPPRLAALPSPPLLTHTSYNKPLLLGAGAAP